MGEWQPIETAPKDGQTIFGIYEMSPDMNGPVMWSEGRVCMLGPRAGECGAGWATAPESGTDPNLPVDDPTHWLPLEEADALDTFRKGEGGA